MPDKNIIEIEELHKIYFLGKTEVHALRGIDINIQAGENLP